VSARPEATDGSRDSTATRHLCAGAVLDRKFAEQVISELFSERHRWVAPSLAVDVVPIAYHGIRSMRRRAVRDVALLLVLLFLLSLAPLPGIAVLALAAWIRWLSFHGGASARQASVVLAAAGVVLGGGLYASLVWLWLQDGKGLLSGPWRGPLTAGGMDNLVPFMVALPILVLVAGLVRYLHWHTSHAVIDSELRRDNYHPKAAETRLLPGTRSRLEVIAEQQYSESAVYDSAAAYPFVGAGLVDENAEWTLSVDLRRKAASSPARIHRSRGGGLPPRGMPPGTVAFDAIDLYRHVQRHFAQIGPAGLSEGGGAASMHVFDAIFVDGLTLRHHEYGSRAPVLPMPRPEMERQANASSGYFRYFLCLRLASWDGRVVTTGFLHLAVRGHTLHVEFTPCLLPPPRSPFGMIDVRSFPTIREQLTAAGVAWTGALSDPMLPIRSLGSLFGFHARCLARRAHVRWMVWEGRDIDRGARTSIRQLGESVEPRHSFQWLDARKYHRIMTAQVLNAVTTFLDRKGVDTSWMPGRRTAILTSITAKSSRFRGTAIIGPEARVPVRVSEKAASR
jgi:hypothetical protein